MQTRSQTKSSRVKLPELHGIDKGSVLHIKPLRQKSVNPPAHKRSPIPKPRIRQGKAGIRRKVRIVPPLPTPAPKAAQSLPETVTQSQETVQTQHKSPAQTDIKQPIGLRIENRPIPFYPDQTLRPPPRPPDLKGNREIY